MLNFLCIVSTVCENSAYVHPKVKILMYTAFSDQFLI
jgi:hypothetical protein